MNVITTDIEGVLIVEPKVFGDERGYFLESFSLRDFIKAAGDVVFVQDNESKSSYGVVRGLHFQRPPFSQSKLVRCVYGRVLDVAVDLRETSPTYGKSVTVELSGENHRMIFIPKGFAHGFSVLSGEAVFQYKCDDYYHPESEGGVNALDPSLGIDWGIPPEKMVMSEKDRIRGGMGEFVTPFRK